MKKFYDLHIFSPAIMDKHWTEILQPTLGVIRTILFQGLTKQQEQILSVTNYHYWDPNEQDKGENLSLIDLLIFEAIGATSTFRSPTHSYTELFLHDLEKYTGMTDLAAFHREIAEINAIWTKKKIAEIKIIDTNGNSPTISFELLEKTR